MPVEKHRKKLMDSNPQWGDKPPSRKGLPQLASRRSSTQDAADHIVRGKNPDSLSTTIQDDYSCRASQLDALLENGMNHIVSAPPHSKAQITTKKWSLDALISTSDNFHHIPRISALSSGLTTKLKEYDSNGVPLVIEKWHEHAEWSHVKFSVEYFVANTKPAVISVRNVHDWTDKQMSLPEFIIRSRAAPVFATEEENERLYGKDAFCPKQWSKWLQEANVIPPTLLPDGPNDYFRYRPQEEPVETLMCYLGIGDTFTPCHKDLCASSGQNLMTYTENNGSSFWFMTESSDASKAADYFQKLNQELDHENHVITVEELAKAPFNVYITEQKLGDLVLVPPRSCHQVVNNGGITIKTSWSRMTLKGLSTALYHELPLYRRVCRPETYQIKSTIYYALLRQTEDLDGIVSRLKRDTLSRSRFSQAPSESASRSPTPATSAFPVSDSRHEPPPLPRSEEDRLKSLIATVRSLLELFGDILVDEYSPDAANTQCISSNGENIVCDFCGADIFQSFLECRRCVQGNDGSGGGYIICGGCYTEGRSCKCQIMTAIQCREFAELLHDRRKVIEVLKASTNLINKGSRPQFSRFIPESDLLGCKYYGAFRAACVLMQTRLQQKKDIRVCTHPKVNDPSHETTLSWTLNCKKCHSAKCFGHLLTDSRVHSVEALLVHAIDKTHTNFHHLHQTRKRKFELGIESLHQCQENGSRPDPQLLLVHNALKYGTCRPLNPTFMNLGWYDISAQIINVLEESETTSGELLTSDFTSPLTTLPPSPIFDTRELEPHTSADLESPEEPLPSTSMTGSIPPPLRNRKLMEFVLIPPPPYSILRKPKPGNGELITAEPLNTTSASEQGQDDSRTIPAADASPASLKKRKVSDASPPNGAVVVSRAKKISKEKVTKRKHKEPAQRSSAKDTPLTTNTISPENEPLESVPGPSDAQKSSSQQSVASGSKGSKAPRDKMVQLPKRKRPSETPKASTSMGNLRIRPKKTASPTAEKTIEVSLMDALNNAGAQNTQMASDSEDEEPALKQRRIFKRRRLTTDELEDSLSCNREESPAMRMPGDDGLRSLLAISRPSEHSERPTRSNRRRVANRATTASKESNVEHPTGGKKKEPIAPDPIEPDDDAFHQTVNPTVTRKSGRKGNQSGSVSVNFIDLSTMRKRKEEGSLAEENAVLRQRVAQLTQEVESKDRDLQTQIFTRQVAEGVVQQVGETLTSRISSQMWQHQLSMQPSAPWFPYPPVPTQHLYNQGQYDPGPGTSSQFDGPYHARDTHYHPHGPWPPADNTYHHPQSVIWERTKQSERPVHLGSVRRGIPKFPKRSRPSPRDGEDEPGGGARRQPRRNGYVVQKQLQRLTWDRPGGSSEQAGKDISITSNDSAPHHHPYHVRHQTRRDSVDSQDGQVHVRGQSSGKSGNANPSSSPGTSQHSDIDGNPAIAEEHDSLMPSGSPRCDSLASGLQPDASSSQIPLETVDNRSHSTRSSSQDWEDGYDMSDEIIEAPRETRSQDKRTSPELPDAPINGNIFEDFVDNPWT